MLSDAVSTPYTGPEIGGLGPNVRIYGAHHRFTRRVFDMLSGLGAGSGRRGVRWSTPGWGSETLVVVLERVDYARDIGQGRAAAYGVLSSMRSSQIHSGRGP